MDHEVLNQRRPGLVLTLRQQDGASYNTCRTNSKVDEVEEDFTVPEQLPHSLREWGCFGAIPLIELIVARAGSRKCECLPLQPAW